MNVKKIMYSKNIQNKKTKNILNRLNNSNDCKVSKASAEIMLDRFCGGKEIEFPFSK